MSFTYVFWQIEIQNTNETLANTGLHHLLFFKAAFVMNRKFDKITP